MEDDGHQISIRGLKENELTMLRMYAKKNDFESPNAFLLFWIRDELA